MIAILAFVFALLDGSPWDPFSSQSERPYPLASPTAASHPGSGVLSVMGYVGVPSRSGIPAEGGGCARVIARTVPFARSLAVARAALLARDLGITLGALDAEAESKWAPPGSPFTGFDAPGDDCGMPKFGRPPLTAEVEQSYFFVPPVFEVSAEDESAQPRPTPTPIYPGEYSGNVVPSRSDPPSLIDPPSDPNDVVVSVRGFGSVDADSVSVDIETYASPSTVSPASIDTIVASLRRLPLHATIDESPAALIPFEDDFTHVGHAQMDITAPPRDLDAVRRAVNEAAHRAGLKAEIARTVVADSCETLESRALEDAIARARVDLAKRGFAGHDFRLIYAVEGGLVVDDGRCGPELDAFPYVGGFTDSSAPIPDAAVSGSVAVTLVVSPV
jgi:hypothetical protein